MNLSVFVLFGFFFNPGSDIKKKISNPQHLKLVACLQIKVNIPFQNKYGQRAVLPTPDILLELPVGAHEIGSAS